MKILERLTVKPFILNENIVNEVKERDILLDKNNFLLDVNDINNKYYTDTKTKLYNYLSDIMYDKYSEKRVSKEKLINYLIFDEYTDAANNNVHYKMQEDFDLNKSIELICEYVLFKSRGNYYLGINSILFNINMKGAVFSTPTVNFSYFQLKKKRYTDKMTDFYSDYLLNRRIVLDTSFDINKELTYMFSDNFFRRTNYDNFLTDKNIYLLEKKFEPIDTTTFLYKLNYNKYFKKEVFSQIKGEDYHPDRLLNHFMNEDYSIPLFDMIRKHLPRAKRKSNIEIFKEHLSTKKDKENEEELEYIEQMLEYIDFKKTIKAFID